ncbi:endonuclease/exonuclease/phosphatase family protein [Myxococcota bacterium]|nr:endonuclease/exonuclease/phosphatase family protein [Myxococcota bacterium]
MPIPHPRPARPFRYTLARELDALDAHFTERAVPRSAPGKLLVATWNLACFGVQARSRDDLALIAAILQRFDLVALQEVATPTGHLDALLARLGPSFDVVMTDPSGDAERLAYVYRRRKVRRSRLAGELALDPADYPKQTITIRWVRRGVSIEATYDDFCYRPFARAPFLHAFEADGRTFTFANAHLYRGDGDSPGTPKAQLAYCRRALEAHALARWARHSARDDARAGGPVIVLGDLNIPKMDATDEAHQALLRFGLKLPRHATRTGGSNLGNDKTYDQIVLTPTIDDDAIPATGTFDFDNAIFARLWSKLRDEHGARRAVPRFNAHVRFHVSDHRPVWAQLDLA